MAYIDSKRTRIYVNPEWEANDGAPDYVDAESLTSAGWYFVSGVRSDSAQSTPQTQQFYHYGEESAVSTAGPPDRTLTVAASEDLEDDGQSVLRWAAVNNATIGALVLKDGANGYVTPATVVVNDESGDAQGGLRSTGFTITPLGQRIAVGSSGLYEPSAS